MVTQRLFLQLHVESESGPQRNNEIKIENSLKMIKKWILLLLLLLPSSSSSSFEHNILPSKLLREVGLRIQLKSFKREALNWFPYLSGDVRYGS